MPVTLPNVFVPGQVARASEVNANFDAINAAITASFPENPKDYGAIADGGSHQLSTRYGNLAAAQAYYPFATALTQEIDYCAIKKASDTAFGATGAEHGSALARLNRPLYIPSGSYILGADTWKISYGTGLRIFGDGRLSTTITSNAITLLFDGLWYSHVEDIGFATTAGVTCVDLDGHVGGTTRATQACTFESCIFTAGATSSYALAVCRTGSSGAQGSENLFLNCHWFGTGTANTALLYITGFNALNNTVIGGNFQVYGRAAAIVDFGSAHFYSVGFQSTTGYTQILNGGYDIEAFNGGAYSPVTAIGCRSESLRFFHGANAQPPVLMGNCVIGGTIGWTALSAYALNDVHQPNSLAPDGKLHIYRVTTPGVSGAAPPAWPSSGTVADGSIVWTETTVDVVHIDSGVFDDRQNYWNDRHVHQIGYIDEPLKLTAVDYTAKFTDRNINVDTSAGNRIITLPYDANRNSGKVFKVKKITTDANTVTVAGGSRIDGVLGGTYVIPGGARGAVEFLYGEDSGGQQCVWVMGKA